MPELKLLLPQILDSPNRRHQYEGYAAMGVRLDGTLVTVQR